MESSSTKQSGSDCVDLEKGVSPIEQSGFESTGVENKEIAMYNELVFPPDFDPKLKEVLLAYQVKELKLESDLWEELKKSDPSPTAQSDLGAIEFRALETSIFNNLSFLLDMDVKRRDIFLAFQIKGLQLQAELNKETKNFDVKPGSLEGIITVKMPLHELNLNSIDPKKNAAGIPRSDLLRLYHMLKKPFKVSKPQPAFLGRINSSQMSRRESDLDSIDLEKNAITPSGNTRTPLPDSRSNRSDVWVVHVLFAFLFTMFFWIPWFILPFSKGDEIKFYILDTKTKKTTDLEAYVCVPMLIMTWLAGYGISNFVWYRNAIVTFKEKHSKINN